MEIYEKIRYYREHTDFSQRNVAKILVISRNTVKKYWEGRTVLWERKAGSGRKNDAHKKTFTQTENQFRGKSEPVFLLLNTSQRTITF